MSGGVDSSVTAMLLKEQGYNVVGVFLRFWVDPMVVYDGAKENKCCSLETQLRARQVADKLDIPFYVLNLVDAFKEKVVDYYLNGYEKGWTPNPCIMCNRDVKFGLMIDKLSEFGAQYWATGHYASIRENNGIFHLFEAKDKAKDQSYFLYALDQKKLSKTIFPLGNLTKEEVKDLAQKFGLDGFKRTQYQESQNLCFYPEDKPYNFLERYLPTSLQQPGVLKTKDGEVLGTHNGLFHFTIGQRRGIHIKGYSRPLYVTGFDTKDNTVWLGDEADLFSDSCRLEDVTFLNPVFPDRIDNVLVKPRYTKNPFKADLVKENGTYRLAFHSPVRALTPGQSAVFYRNEEVLGGGIII